MKLFNIHFRVGHLLGIGAFLFLAIKYLLSVDQMFEIEGPAFTLAIGGFIVFCLGFWIRLAYQYHQRASK